jgi:hypothetical protein
MTTIVSQAQAVLDASAALAAAASVLGIAVSPNAATLLLGQAWGESYFGRNVQGYDPRMQGSNNWGSIDSTQAWEQTHHVVGFGKFAHTDTLDGTLQTAFVAWFRAYPNQLEAAKGFLQQVAYGNVAALQAALAGSPATYAHWLKVHGYYGATESAYAAMLAGAAQTIARLLSQASAQGLHAADPATAGQGENDFVPVSQRVLPRLLSSVQPPDGVVWFVGPPAAPSSGGGLLAPALAALFLWLFAMATGVLSVPQPLRRVVR